MNVDELRLVLGLLLIFNFFNKSQNWVHTSTSSESILMVKLALDSIADFLAAAKSLLWFSSSSVCNSCISFSCFSINSVFSCWSSYSLFCCCSSNAWEMSRKQVTWRTENLSPGLKFLITSLSLQINHPSTSHPRNRFCLVTQRSSLSPMFECEQPFCWGRASRDKTRPVARKTTYQHSSSCSMQDVCHIRAENKSRPICSSRQVDFLSTKVAKRPDANPLF